MNRTATPAYRKLPPKRPPRKPLIDCWATMLRDIPGLEELTMKAPPPPPVDSPEFGPYLRALIRKAEQIIGPNGGSWGDYLYAAGCLTINAISAADKREGEAAAMAQARAFALQHVAEFPLPFVRSLVRDGALEAAEVEAAGVKLGKESAR